MAQNHYQILGVTENATQTEIKNAYRNLAKQYHPDSSHSEDANTEEKFKAISEAYSVLSDETLKEEYDRSIRHSQGDGSDQNIYYNQSKVRTHRKPTYRKREFTEGAKAKARIAVIILITVVVTIPVLINYHSSIQNYENGMALYEDGAYYDAITKLNRAIKILGGRSVEAAIFGSQIAIYDKQDFGNGRYFSNKGLEYAKAQEDLALLHYLNGLALAGEDDNSSALRAFEKANELGFQEDSISYQLGRLHSFSLDNYEEGLEQFSKLSKKDLYRKEVSFGMGWCYQHLGQHNEAVESLTQALSVDSTERIFYYYRGISEIILKDTTSACLDFHKSFSLGIRQAEEQIQQYCL
ncbi:MAG: DnaJ domain-containing protein [Bacteroidota bacterium]